MASLQRPGQFCSQISKPQTTKRAKREVAGLGPHETLFGWFDGEKETRINGRKKKAVGAAKLFSNDVQVKLAGQSQLTGVPSKKENKKIGEVRFSTVILGLKRNGTSAILEGSSGHLLSCRLP